MLSVVTYIIAAICIVAVNWQHIKDHIHIANASFYRWRHPTAAVNWGHIKERIHIANASFHKWRHPTIERKEMEGEKNKGVTDVESNNALSASETGSASGKAEHHGRRSATITRDLESAVEEV